MNYFGYSVVLQTLVIVEEHTFFLQFLMPIVYLAMLTCQPNFPRIIFMQISAVVTG